MEGGGSRIQYVWAKIRVLGREGEYILHGIQWSTWRGAMDPSVAGRQFFKNSQLGKGYSLAVSIGNMRSVDSRNTQKYEAFLERNLFDTERDNDLVGANYFWHSDFTVTSQKKVD